MPPGSIRLALALYQALLVLCPRDLRRGYGDQMLQVFRQMCRDAYTRRGSWGVMPLAAGAVADLALGATAEYLTVFASFRNEFWMSNRRRSSAIVVFCAYVAFILPSIGYQKMTESVIQSGIQESHPALAISFLLMEIGAVAALLAVLAGGLPVGFATLRYAVTARRHDIAALLFVPVIALAVVATYVLLVVHLVFAHHPSLHGPTRADVVSGIGLIALLHVAAVASGWAVCLAVTRAKIGERIIRFTRLPALITTLAMVMMFAATLVWGLGLLASAPQVFYGNDGALATNTAISWGIVIAVMGIATAIAAIGVGRANAPRQPHAAVAA